MSQTITTTQIRLHVVNEAITRATRECLFLFLYEYKGTISDYTAWATLLEHEQPPQESILLCTIDQNGVVEWKINDPDLIQSPISQPTDINLPIDVVTFNNVSITVANLGPAAAYRLLCAALARFEYTTDTFQTQGAAGQSAEQSTTILFASHSHPAPTQLPQPAETAIEKELLVYMVEFCSERLEWFCSGCHHDSAEVVWLENARSHLGYPPLDFAGISFAQQPLSGESSKPTYFVIESREVAEGDREWQEWSSDTDPANLLRLFVNAVSSEEIDDVNRYWRVNETLDPDNLTAR